MTEAGPFAVFTKSGSFETFQAGAVIFREGDPGDVLYVVRTGIVELRKGDHLLEAVGPGGAFGELALTGRTRRSATAVARDEVSLARVDQERFDRVMGMNPLLARAFMRLIADRLAATNERLVR